MARVKPASFDDRLTLVEHLDELRSRIIFCAISLVIVMVLCFWQNHALLDIAGNPLPNDQQLLTLSPSEPFFTTLTLVLYSAVLLTLPILLYHAYAFILPALSPAEKKTILPLLMMVPVLFIGGVVFAYFVVFPAALDFLLNFNDDQFQIELRAREYYSFFSLTLISVGLLFQIPVGILAVTRLGIVTPDQLAQEPALRDPRDRGPGHVAPRHRPGDDADLDAAARGALRAQPAPRPGPRQAGLRAQSGDGDQEGRRRIGRRRR